VQSVVYNSRVPSHTRIQWWEIAAGVALALLVLWKLAFTNLILARGDAFLYFYPYWEFRAEALLAGRLPLWNPYLFMGAPFLANSQAGVLYPLNWPLVVFSAPVGVKISILVHILIALLGGQLFARKTLGQSPLGALLAGGLFALGGYVTAQVEHVNQLQALAWFPWVLLVIGNWRLTSIFIALQILAGHTQSVFISLTGAALYVLITNNQLPPARRPFCFLLSILIALLLSAAQLLPTLELTRESLRGGGLAWREAISFSLDPRLLGRALLPGYSRSLFSEYVAYIGVAGLALTGLGVARERKRLALLALAVVGLAFAFGAFNPLYAGLAYLPPFNLFRVPARWLFLFAFGAAMLAGHGLDAIVLGRRHWLLMIGGLGLMALAPLGASITPPGETGPLGPPATQDLIGWLIPIALLSAFLLARSPRWLIVALALAELYLASQALPFNRLTAPEAFTSLRPAVTQLLITNNQSPPPRFLSMSALQFDPGDLAELRGVWEPQLPMDAAYDAIVATKHKEVLSPNLPLVWRIAAVDGFDGGVLPLRNYAAFTQLFTGAPSADGRLRENVAVAPAAHLLSLVNARYLITDKVNDRWIDGVFYDLQFTLKLKDGERFDIAHLPPFEATALGLVAESPSGRVEIEAPNSPLLQLPITNNQVDLPSPVTPSRITFHGPLTLRGLALMDTRTGAFQTLTLGRYRLAHSGDVKVYENLDVLPRAFVVPQAIVIEDDAAARAALAGPDFDPARTVILSDGVNGQQSTANGAQSSAINLPAITRYSPESIHLTATGPGYLVLTDAYYPGWSAAVDGQPATIHRADIMFRAVVLPPGEHVVEFRYAPLSVTAGLWISGLAWALMAAVGVYSAWKRRQQRRRPSLPDAARGEILTSGESHSLKPLRSHASR
jgi:hypothetical protein